jgi:hypothetical protein
MLRAVLLEAVLDGPAEAGTWRPIMAQHLGRRGRGAVRPADARELVRLLGRPA